MDDATVIGPSGWTVEYERGVQCQSFPSAGALSDVALFAIVGMPRINCTVAPPTCGCEFGSCGLLTKDDHVSVRSYGSLA
jgi:hypothetical protein